MRKNRLISYSGCLGCRLGKKKCDEDRPACSNCVRRRRRCVYPGDNPSDFEAVLIAGRAKKTRERNKTLILLGSTVSGWPVAQQPDNSGFADQICIAYTLHNLFKGFNEPVKTNYRTSALTVQTETSFTRRDRSLAWQCLRALGLTFYGMTQRDATVLRQGLAAHDVATKAVQKSIQNPVTQTSSDTLAAMVFLMNFALLRPTQDAQWLHHVQLLSYLIRQSGPEVFSHTSRRFILENNRLAIIQAASICRDPCFLNAPDWKYLPWADEDIVKSAYQRLLDVYAEIPGFEFLFRESLGGDNKINYAYLLLLDTHLEDIRERLHAWRLSIEPVPVHLMSPEDSRNVLTPKLEIVQAFDFEDMSVALSIVIFNLVLLVIFQYKEAIKAQMMLHPEESSHEERPSQEFDDGLGERGILGLQVDALLGPRPLMRAVIASDEICACVPWILSKSGYGAGALYLIGALQVAISAIQKSQPERVAWMLGVLSAIQIAWQGHDTWRM